MEFKTGTNRIYIEDNGKEIGEITFSPAGEGMIIIDHTGVNNDYRDQGLAKQLVYKAADYARENNLLVVPLCPYAKSVFEKDVSLHDLVKK